MTFNKVKGMVDYYPQEQAIVDYLSTIMKQQAKAFGFEFVEPPVIEELKTLTHKEGEETKSQIFVLEKKGKEELALRFDLTVPAARMFMQKQKQLPKPVRWFMIARNWRYERPQKGRLREFYQLSVECFGSNSAEAEAENIRLAISIMEKLGLTNKDVSINLNNRKLLQGFLQPLVPAEFLNDAIAIIDKREKISENDFFLALKDLKVKDPSKIIEVIDLVDIESIEKIKKNKLAQEGFEELKSLYQILPQEYVRISLSTARGLSYYTGNVFEFFDTNKEFRSLAGGGRYDNMVSQFGGIDTPAVGFAIGFCTLTLLLEKKGLLPDFDLLDYYICPLSKNSRQAARPIATRLRKKYSVELDITDKSLTKQLEYASKRGFKKVIILGDKDLKEKKVTIKELETGKEEKVLITSLK